MLHGHTSRLKAKIKNGILRTEAGYRLHLKYKFGIDKPRGYPDAPWENAVLLSRREWETASAQVARLGLPSHSDLQKNWDSLAALHCILGRTDRTSCILDAGAELYSAMLPWLFLYGYRNLVGINLSFNHPIKRGPIRYEYGDITRTRFQDNTFDAITCLSVVEHGVDLRAYFQETWRILKPNGVLITSTDYWTSPIDTHGQVAFGAPIRVFSQQEILSAWNLASETGLEPTSPIKLECREKAVRWEEFSLAYTFLIFTLRKRVGGAEKKQRPDDRVQGNN